MLVLQIVSKPSNCFLNLDHVSSIEYNKDLGELTLVSGAFGRTFYVDKDVPENKIFDAVKMALSPIYEPRSLQTHGVQLMLNLLPFQTALETVL
jgi:hypothetical protein